MLHLIRLLAFGVLPFVTVSLVQADEKKEKVVSNKIIDGPKADVIVGGSEKTVVAKVGQLVEIGVGCPLAPPFPSDFEITIDGKKVDSKTYDGDVLLDGRPVPGTKVKLIHFKAAGEGKQKLLMLYKQGELKHRREIELEVAK